MNYKVFCAVNADEAPLFTYGYFANDLASLRRAVQEESANFKCIYARLEGVVKDSFERRFNTAYGYFSLFLPLDETENEERY